MLAIVHFPYEQDLSWQWIIPKPELCGLNHPDCICRLGWFPEDISTFLSSVKSYTLTFKKIVFSQKQKSKSFSYKQFSAEFFQLQFSKSAARHIHTDITYIHNIQTILSLYVKILCECSVFSCIWLFVISWIVACQIPLCMGFSRQECWSGLLFPSPEDLPNPGIRPLSPPLAGTFFTTEPGKLIILRLTFY